MGNPWFQFKQFRVSQEKSALKVGTDGVLLGAWCNVNGAKSILDVGTGTGVIALMLAQRTEKLIDNAEFFGRQGKIPVCKATIDPRKDRFIDNRNEFESNHHVQRIEAVEINSVTDEINVDGIVGQADEIKIVAIEINSDACSDASVNFRNSPWKERLTLVCEDVRQFQPSGAILYDLIVSNPPFFKNSLRSADLSSSVARHDVSLSFDHLVLSARKLLAPEGRLAVIIPTEAFDDFRETARLAGFYLSNKTMVIPKVGKSPKRILLEFSVVPCYPVEEELVILLNDHQYSVEFVLLTRDFYLNFE